MKKTLLALILFLSCSPSPVPAQWLYDQDAVLVSAEGAVTIQDTKGVTAAGRTGVEVPAGGMVSTGWDSQAEIRFFDGSVLKVKSDSQLRVLSLAHPTDQQKMIRFKLLAGLVEATVHKLMTASSLFEIEAGGVVCGVRGTQFSVAYDPSRDLVHVIVLEGTVYAKADGNSLLINSGGEMEFIHGHSSANLPDQQKLAPQKTGERLADLRAKTDLKAEEEIPLSLMDMNGQFMAGIFVNGSSPGSNSALAMTGPLSSVGLRGGLPGLLLGVPVKLPKLP